jgi:hypothetical protein
LAWHDAWGNIHRYRPDFELDGELVEVKGYLRAEDQMKYEAVLREHPDLRWRIVFSKDIKKFA